MFAEHSLHYDFLPDFFVGFDLYSSEDQKFIHPKKCLELLEGTSIDFITPRSVELFSLEDVQALTVGPSRYRSGNPEGVVMTTTDRWVDAAYKMVRADFQRCEGWTERSLIKNQLG